MTVSQHQWTQATRPRPHCASQDRSAVASFVVDDEPVTVAIVVDGAGGVAGGARAADLVVSTVLARCQQSPPRDLGDLCVLLGEIDAAVAADAEAGVAALAIVVVSRTQVLAASVDDAEVWLASEGWQILDGKRRFGSGYGLGTGVALCDVASVPIAGLEVVILWSDGAWGAQSVAAVEAMRRDGVDAAALLARSRTADDATVVVGSATG